MADLPGAGLAGLVPPDVLEWIRREPLRLPRPVWGRRHGHHPSARAGVGMEFRDHRPYVPGDDPRKLDWRAIARRDRLVLRRTETEDALDIVFLLDASGGMAYGDAPHGKHQVARTLVAALAWIGARQGDRVALAVGTRDQADATLLRRGQGRERLAAILEALTSNRAEGRCPWSDLLDEAVPRLRPRSLVIIVSDLLDPGAGATDPIAAENDLWSGLSQIRARGHEVLALQILHRDEVEFPWSDRKALEFIDLRGVRENVEAPGGSLRSDYLKRLNAHLAALASSCERHGVALERVLTDQSLARALTRILGRLAGKPSPHEVAP